jgi:hypothetical protein
MKLIADLNVNGNQLRDGEKNIGPIVEEITPVNPSEIDLTALRSAILDNSGKVPVNFTFEDFITKLFVKVNAEIATTGTHLPKITVSGALSGTTTNQELEVGEASATYTLTNTATKGTYTDGEALTHAITNGRSTESESYVAIGCTEGNVTWNGDSDTNVKTVSLSMTQFENGQEASRDSQEMTVGNITITQAYSASTLDVSLDSNSKPVFRSSYGNALYNAAGEAISAGSCTATTTNGKKVTVKTHFYSWVKGTAYKGAVALTQGNQSLSANDVIICPADRTPVITWTQFTPDDNQPASDMYTKETKYLKLPSEGITTNKLVDSIPDDAPYKTYHVYTFNSKLPSGISNAKISIAD